MPKVSSKKAVPSVRPYTQTILPLLVLAALTIITYANSLHGQFVFDDQQLVLQNSNIINVRALSDVLHLAGGWRNLLVLSYGLNYYWSGLDTYSYHAVNLALHLINVILVYFIILEIAGRDVGRYAAFTGAAVFSVHTLLSSAVSYIAGRSSVLCAVFYFSAVLLFLKGTRRDVPPTNRAVLFVLAAISGILAWQSKQEAIALPVFMAAIVWLRNPNKNLKYAAALTALPIVLAIAMRKQLSALFASVMGNTTLVNAGFDRVLSPGTYFRTYIASIVDYFFPRFIFPADLNADPHILAVAHWYSPDFVFSVLVLGSIAWLLARPAKSSPLLTFGLAAVLFSPLTAYAWIPLADVVLEHRAYIPGLGVAILSASLFCWVARNWPSLKIAVPAVTIVVLMLMTIDRNPVFANEVTLWQDVVKKSPHKPRAHFNLGAAYQNAHRLNEAISEYQIALKLKPDIYAAYSNLAAIELDSGQLDAGEQTLLKVTQLAPDYTEGFINLAVLYLRKHESDKALEAVDRALALNPSSFAAFFNKGEALTQKGDFAAAVESYKNAVHLRPDLPGFQLSLGRAYLRAGDLQSAQAEFEALTGTEVGADANRDLAALYDRKGDSDKAIEYLQRALQMKPVYPDAHHDLGVIYFKRKNYDEAAKEFEITLQQQPDFGPAVLNLAAVQQLKGDIPGARQTLQKYVQQFGTSSSPFIAQAQARLTSLK